MTRCREQENFSELKQYVVHLFFVVSVVVPREAREKYSHSTQVQLFRKGSALIEETLVKLSIIASKKVPLPDQLFRKGSALIEETLVKLPIISIQESVITRETTLMYFRFSWRRITPKSAVQMQ